MSLKSRLELLQPFIRLFSFLPLKLVTEYSHCSSKSMQMCNYDVYPIALFLVNKFYLFLHHNHRIKARFYSNVSNPLRAKCFLYIRQDLWLLYFKEPYRIHLTDSFFVVRVKTNWKYKTVKWKRRMPKNIMTVTEVKLTRYLSEKKYSESFRLVLYYDGEITVSSLF